MKRQTIGYIVKVEGTSLELDGNTLVSLTAAESKKSSAFYASRLYIGSSTTVFESRRAANRAIARTKKALASNPMTTYFTGKQFEIERLTRLVEEQPFHQNAEGFVV